MDKTYLTRNLWLGAYIRAARKSMGLRQGDVAAMTGLSISHLSDIERGITTPTLPTLLRIGQALHRPLEYFLQESNFPRSLGMVIQEMSIGGKAAIRFAELVESETNGEIKLRLFHHSSLGTAKEPIEALKEGAIHMYLDEPLSYEPYVPICGVVFQPYFFREREHYHRFLQSKLFSKLVYEPLLGQGIRLLNPASNWVCGSFEILFSTEPVFTPEDLVGRNFRSYPSQVSVAWRRALGANPVVVEWAKVYEGFEQGLIDVFLVPAAYFLATQVHKLARYATLIHYGYTLNLTIAINELEYLKLSPDVQKILIWAAEESGAYCTRLAEEQNEIDLRQLNEEHGVFVIHPDEAAWREPLSTVLRQVCCGRWISPELYDAIQSL